MALNSVNIIGNLTADIELRYTPSGVAVTNFTVAINTVYISKNGEKKEEVCFARVTAWNKLAERCSQYLSKGSKVCVEGQLSQEEYSDKEGNKRQKTYVKARNVHFLTPKPIDNNEPDQPDTDEGVGNQ